MKNHVRVIAGLGTAGLIVGLAVPAQAGTKWGSPQEVSSKLGRAIGVSTDGRVAAWIRTNKASGNGPVRTAWYQSTKKGWTPSAPIPGTAAITNVQLSTDGNYAFAESPGTGYLMAKRSSKNTWGAAQTVASGTKLSEGQMSSDGSTIVWVDWAGATDYPTQIPGSVKSATRKPDGTWNPPVEVGKINYAFYYSNYRTSPIALSADGSTLAWFDDTYGLKVSAKQADGTWGAPTLIKQYASDPYLNTFELSANGAVLIWVQDDTEGILTSQRVSGAWTPVGYVDDVADVTSAAISPDGLTVAYGTGDKQLLARKWNGTTWAKAVVVGSSSVPAIALTNTTLAWTSSVYSGSTLRVSIYKKSKWQPSTKVSSAAQAPALNPGGTTLVYGATSNKRIYSVKR